MKVLISGAGIAGLSLAPRLRQRGLTPVVERSPRLRDGGYMLGLSDPGLDAADRMGVADALRAARHAQRQRRLLRVAQALRHATAQSVSTGTRLARSGNGASGGRGMAGDWAVNRGRVGRPKQWPRQVANPIAARSPSPVPHWRPIVRRRFEASEKITAQSPQCIQPPLKDYASNNGKRRRVFAYPGPSR